MAIESVDDLPPEKRERLDQIIGEMTDLWREARALEAGWTSLRSWSEAVDGNPEAEVARFREIQHSRRALQLEHDQILEIQ